MAQKKQLAQRKQELIQQLSGSRDTISQHKKAISTKLSPKTNIRSLCSKTSLKDPKVAVVGSFLLAATTSLLLKRKKRKKEYKKRSKKLLLLGFGFKLIKPAVKKAVFKKAKTLMVQKLAQRGQQFVGQKEPIFREVKAMDERQVSTQDDSSALSTTS